MKNWLLLFVVLSLTGCVLFPQGAAFRLAFRDLSQKAADAALADALWAVCLGTSRGSHMRWVGTDDALADAIITICASRPTADFITTNSTEVDG